MIRQHIFEMRHRSEDRSRDEQIPGCERTSGANVVPRPSRLKVSSAISHSECAQRYDHVTVKVITEGADIGVYFTFNHSHRAVVERAFTEGADQRSFNLPVGYSLFCMGNHALQLLRNDFADKQGIIAPAIWLLALAVVIPTGCSEVMSSGSWIGRHTQSFRGSSIHPVAHAYPHHNRTISRLSTRPEVAYYEIMMPRKNQTLACLYGWAEGPWLGRRFVSELASQGYILTDDIAVADIIVAHSLGCYVIPNAAHATLILLVGPSSDSLRRLASGFIHKLSDEFSYHKKNRELIWWVNKLLHNIWYVVSRPRSTVDALTRNDPTNMPSSQGRRVILVRPTNDPLIMTDPESAARHAGYEYAEIVGGHDHVWERPGPYVELLNRVAETSGDT